MVAEAWMARHELLQSFVVLDARHIVVMIPIVVGCGEREANAGR